MKEATISLIDAMGQLYDYSKSDNSNSFDYSETSYNLEENNMQTSFPNQAYNTDNTYTYYNTGLNFNGSNFQQQITDINKFNNPAKSTNIHYIVPNKNGKNMLYINFNNDYSHSYSAIFCNFCIHSCRRIMCDKVFEAKMYILVILLNNRYILLDEANDFNQKHLAEKFISQGFLFYHKKKDEVSQLLINYISQLLSNNAVEFIPYVSGWYFEGEKYIYRLSCDNGFNYNLQIPFYEDKLLISDKYDPFNCCKCFLSLYASFFRDEETRVLMLSVLTYSILFSKFAIELHLKLNKFILLTCDSDNLSIINTIVDMFLKIFINKESIPIYEKKKKLDKSLIKYKDEPLIIDVRYNSGQCSSYQFDTNINYLKSIFLGNNCLTTGGNKHHIQAPPILLNYNLEYLLNHNEYIQIEICEEKVNLELLSDFIFQKGIYTKALLGYIKYLEFINSNYINLTNIEINPNSCKYYYKSYRLLASALKTFYNYAEALGVNFNSEFGISDDMENILYKYFSKDNYTDTIPDLFKLTLKKLINNNTLPVCSREMLTESNVNSVLVIDKKQMWLTANAIDNILIPAMKIDISLNKLLKTLDREGLLHTYCKNYRVKRTVSINGEQKQKYFIIFCIDYNVIFDDKKTILKQASEVNEWDF